MTAFWREMILGAPRYRGPKSDHFNGHSFHNPIAGSHTAWQALKWFLTRKKGPWPSRIKALNFPAPAERVGAGELSVTFINHATTLIQIDGRNILTDPVWSPRASPFRRLGPKRVRPPGLSLEQLPPIDAILLSHNHYDHLDTDTLKALHNRHAAPIYSGLGNAALLAWHGLPTGVDMDWWQSLEIAPGHSLTAVPAQHYSRRGLFDGDGSLWAGFILESPAGTLYFAGDTAYDSFIDEIHQRFPKIDLALLPIGGYKPRWFMGPDHMTPEEAVRAHKVLNVRRSVAVHFGTFQLSDEAESEPVARLQAELEKQGLDDEFWVLGFGESRAMQTAKSNSE